MFGNNMVTGMSLSGIVILTLGTVLGIIGMATSDWFIFENDAVVVNSAFWNETFASTQFGENAMAGTYNTSISCRIGLWQICCSDYGDLLNCNSIAREVTTEVNVMRILMAVSLVFLIFSVILLLVFSFKESCHSRIGSKQCITLLVALGIMMFLMTTISCALFEYIRVPGFFQSTMEDDMGTYDQFYGSAAGFDWSFIVALVGSLINPLGLFLICTQWHFTEDKEAGVKFNYDAKRHSSTGNAFDTYI